MFRYHFLSHFLAELNEICCGSLLNSILKRTEGNFFKHSDFFIQQNQKFCRILVVFFRQKMIKNVLCNKVKMLVYVSSFVYLLCVCNFSVHLKKRS